MKPRRSLTALVLGIALALLMLAMAAPLARAQAGVPLPACVNRAPLPAPPPSAPACLPEGPLGGTAALIREANAAGVAVAWWCAPVGGRVSLHLYALRWSALTPAMALDLTELGLASDKGAHIKAMLTRHQTSSSLDMCDVWGPARERINAAMPAPVPAPPPPPPPPSWRVSLPTAFSTNGSALTGVAGVAAVGTACDCSAPLRIGAATYCTFAGAPRANVVAQCKQ